MLTISRSVGRNGGNVANDVTLVQILLNANLARLVPFAPLVEDGKSGSKTIGLIEEFQKRIERNTSPTGRVEPGSSTLNQLVSAITVAPPSNLTAKYDNVRFAGKRRQMTTGRITVNHHTYLFTCGGHGRGNIPAGTYQVTKHRNSRDGRAYSHDGVGYSFALSDIHDPRVGGADRSLLRIHPDGGTAGTNGCIGILGGAATQRAFRDDMNGEIDRSRGSSAQLRVVGMS